MIRRTSSVNRLVFLIIACLCAPASLNASTVREVNLEEASLNTALIFEGRVISQETRPSPQDNRPYTYITFQIVEVLKGVFPHKQIEIGFAGGTINGMTLSVTGMHMPQMQESGVYFVESLTRELVHPLYGWSQGHYVIDNTNAITNVHRASSRSRATPEALLAAQSLSDLKQQIRNILGTPAP